MSNPPKDRRKYQRVQFEASPQSLAVSIDGHGDSVVFDMSYSGAALAQPHERPIEGTGMDVTIRLRTENDESVIQGSVIRATGKMIAINFKEVPSLARIIIDRLVSDRMIGLNMYLIDPEHYSPHVQFSHWFHGPKETNLFLWTQDHKLEKAQMDLNEISLIYDENSFFFENRAGSSEDPSSLNQQQILQKTLAIVSQMHSNLNALKDFKKVLEEQAK